MEAHCGRRTRCTRVNDCGGWFSLQTRGRAFRLVAKHPVLDYVTIICGSLIVALALNWFLVPNKIAAGGVSGLATVIHYVTGLPVGVTILSVNIPLFLLSLKILGSKFGLKAFVGAAATGLFVDILAPFIHPPTTDAALASIYGGALVGLGIGMTFRAGGSTGGTDIAAQLLNHYFRLGLGRLLLVADGVVILFAGLTFNAELALYAFIAAYITSHVIDFIQEGGTFAKAAFIVSSRSADISEAVLHTMDRGVTALSGEGMFTRESRPVLFVIVSRPEIVRLRQLVAQIDPRAFMVVTDVSEVLGEGFGPLDGQLPQKR